jgi:heme/copper-type cytochrome/quinol oxidase subunit 3
MSATDSLREKTFLREPWPSVARQREGVAFGMWTFLVTEVLFFGALILVYAVYRHEYPLAFREAAAATNLLYGTINTALLLTSSFVMTIALDAASGGMRRFAIFCLLATAALGFAFLVVKGLEYRDDIAKNLVPGPRLPSQAPAAQLFYALYWVMTGIHAIHLLVGVALALSIALFLARETLLPESTALEASGLYWHFVDTVWLVLYALIYLPGRS